VSVDQIDRAHAGGFAAGNKPVIAGIADPGDTVTLYDGVRFLGTAVADNNGNWSLTPDTALRAGSHDFTAIAMDAAGDRSASSTPFSAAIPAAPVMLAASHAMLEAVAPAVSAVATPDAPVLLGMVDRAGGDIWNFVNGGASQDPNPMLAFSAHAGDTLALYDNGTLLGTMTAVEGTNRWTLPTLSNGVHNLSMTESNAAGATSAAMTVSFTVDTTPHAPVVTQVLDSFGAFEGALWSGATSNDATPQISGTGRSGEVIKLYDGAQLIGSTQVGYDSTWTLKSPLLADGAHDLSMVQVNAFGASSAAPHFDVVIDTTVPAAPTIDTVGQVNEGSTTTETWPVISGTGHAGDTIQVYNGATRIGITEVDGTGHWSVQPSWALSNGAHDLSATATGLGGNTGAASAHFDFTVGAGLLQAQAVSASDDGVHTLQVAGDHQVLDLTSLTGKTAAAHVSGVEAIDLGGHANTLKLSLTDVLNLGEQDLFKHDGNQQVMVSGSAADSVNLSNAHIAGVAEGQWTQHGTAQVGGVTYNAYENAAAQAELLVQHGVQVALHN
jgi:hypothetical protein